MKKLKGIRPQGKKWEVYVKVAGKFIRATFDELDVPKMRAWQEQQKSTVAAAPQQGTVAEKAAEYFAKPEIAAQPYVDQKKAHLELWLERLGRDTPIAAITRDQVEAVLQTWLKTFAEATVYHRRASLLAVFTHAYGTHAENVVLDTTVPAAWTPRDQSVDYATLVKILETMPTERLVRKGIRQPSVARLVCAVLMHTGVRPCDLRQVRRRDHVDWQRGIVQMPPTRKGEGGEGWWPCILTTEGFEAMRAFDVANLYGAFSPAAVSKSWKRACRRVLGHETSVHLYSTRHSIGADVFRLHGDTATVGRVLGHAPGSRMSEQYSKGAHAEVDRRVVEAMAAARRATTEAAPDAPAAPRSGKKLGTKLGARHKFNTRTTLRRVG